MTESERAPERTPLLEVLQQLAVHEGIRRRILYARRDGARAWRVVKVDRLFYGPASHAADAEHEWWLSAWCEDDRRGGYFAVRCIEAVKPATEPAVTPGPATKRELLRTVERHVPPSVRTEEARRVVEAARALIEARSLVDARRELDALAAVFGEDDGAVLALRSELRCADASAPVDYEALVHRVRVAYAAYTAADRRVLQLSGGSYESRDAYVAALDASLEAQKERERALEALLGA